MAPNPTPTAAPLTDVELRAGLQHVDCRHRPRCLEIAGRWQGFACTSCEAHDPITRTERMIAIVSRRRG